MNEGFVNSTWILIFVILIEIVTVVADTDAILLVCLGSRDRPLSIICCQGHSRVLLQELGQFVDVNV